jgi:lipopolysaccharide biosynthesis regulator YciM
MMMSDYPNLWKRGLIQANVRQRANHRCEQCGMEFHPGTNLAVSAVNSLGKPMIGTVHHIDHNKQNCAMRNLVYLCQSCHYKLHLRDWKPGDLLLKEWQNKVPHWIAVRSVDYVRQLALELFYVD